jgi:TolB-like protein
MAADAARSQAAIAFGPFHLDARKRLLEKDGVPIALGSRAMDVLIVLVERAGEVVSKQELTRRVWPNITVDESGLRVHMAALRKALGDGRDGVRYLTNVSGRGYCFVAPVTVSLDAEPAVRTQPIGAPIPELQASTAPSPAPPALPALALPDCPSIAVLPFANLSGDPQQQYFADGMVEEITTALSRFKGLFVIARNSSFTYKGKAVDVKQVGRELGVRYVLEGSVRKASNRVRITGQLIDASTGGHLWAERFDGSLEDVFELQDGVTSSVVGALIPTLRQAEIARVKHKPTQSLDAYDHYLRGIALFYNWTKEANTEAQQHYYKAIEIDPDFASAYGFAAWTYRRSKANRWTTDKSHETAEALRLAQIAVEIGSDDAISLSRGGDAIAYVAGQVEAGAIYIDRALELNPNLAFAWFASAWVRIWLGDPETALKHLTHAARLSPLDPVMAIVSATAAFAHFLAGRYEEASSRAELALPEIPNLHLALRTVAASHALAGRLDLARNALSRLREIDPALRVSGLQELAPFRHSEDLARFAEGLRRAGLPE